MRAVITLMFLSLLASAQEASDTLFIQRLTTDESYSLGIQNGAYRFEVRPEDYVFNGNRSQIKTDTIKASHYSFDLRVEEYNYMEGQFFSLADWHLHPKVARENNKKGWGYRSTISIILVRDKIVVGLRPMNGGKLKKLIKMPVDTGWMHFDMKVVWSSDPKKGEVEIQLGSQKKALKNIPTLYQDGKATYFKLGIYRSAAYKDTCAVSFRKIEMDGQWLAPDFVMAAKGEGKGYKKNGIDKGMQLDKYEEHLKGSEKKTQPSKQSDSPSAPSELSQPEDEEGKNKKKLIF